MAARTDRARTWCFTDFHCGFYGGLLTPTLGSDMYSQTDDGAGTVAQGVVLGQQLEIQRGQSTISRGRAYPNYHGPYVFQPNSLGRFIVWQLEICDESGRLHHQGYVEFKRSMRRDAAKRLLGGDHIHIEPRRGTQSETISYCKEIGKRAATTAAHPHPGPHVIGTMAASQRANALSKWRSVLDMIKANVNGQELCEAHPSIIGMYNRGVNAMRFIQMKTNSRIWRSLNCEWYWGPTGLGKSRKAEYFNNAGYRLSTYADKTTWWDGYEGEKDVIIDELVRGSIPYAELLCILDGYQYRLGTKGGHTYALWTHVVITSNSSPQELYGMDIAPLLRRLNTVTEFVTEWTPEGEGLLDLDRTRADLGNTTGLRPLPGLQHAQPPATPSVFAYSPSVAHSFSSHHVQ